MLLQVISGNRITNQIQFTLDNIIKYIYEVL
jgi:hypothetical protein